MWWRDRDALRRCITDLIASELVRTRRSGAGLPPRPWAESLRLDETLGVDSLERLNLATALAEFIQLHRAGVEDALLARRTLGDWLDIAELGLARHDDALTFRTSGSSGVPKSCAHTLAALGEEVDELARLFAGSMRVLHAVPGHHIYGFLFTVLLPQRLGLSADRVIDLRDSSPALLAHAVRPGDLIVGHPDFWQAVARAVPFLPESARGVTSTAPCPDAVSEAVAQTGIGSLHHLYGASETAGIGWRASWREPYQLFPFWRRDGLSPDRLVRESASATQHFTLQDELLWHDPRHFAVLGRRDAAVQVGGVNVFPSQVAATLRRHPMVADAAVRLMRPDEGARLKAFIVPHADLTDVNDMAALDVELRRWMAEHLSTPERPQALRFGIALPRTENGKAEDWDADAVPASTHASIAS